MNFFVEKKQVSNRVLEKNQVFFSKKKNLIKLN